MRRKVRDMLAYSLDLRQKVVAAVERGDSTIEEVASSFGVGLTFVEKALAEAITLVTKADIRGWFKHCGYKVTSVGMPL